MIKRAGQKSRSKRAWGVHVKVWNRLPETWKKRRFAAELCRSHVICQIFFSRQIWSAGPRQITSDYIARSRRSTVTLTRGSMMSARIRWALSGQIYRWIYSARLRDLRNCDKQQRIEERADGRRDEKMSRKRDFRIRARLQIFAAPRDCRDNEKRPIWKRWKNRGQSIRESRGEEGGGFH